jgi:hypothetical protein
MMRRYNLRLEDGRWTVVDSMTQQTAELDGVAMSRMAWREACEMVGILNNLERLSFISDSYTMPTRSVR